MIYFSLGGAPYRYRPKVENNTSKHVIGLTSSTGLMTAVFSDQFLESWVMPDVAVGCFAE